MVVEYALAASVPGFLITLHHVVQLARPYIGYGSDAGGRHSMDRWRHDHPGYWKHDAAYGATLANQLGWIGHVVAALGYLLIGVDQEPGTSLLVLLSKQVSDQRKPAAASLVWFMMIMGFAVTGGITGQLLDPFSEARLLTVVCGTAAIALVVTFTAIIGIEKPTEPAVISGIEPEKKPRLRRLSGRCGPRIMPADSPFLSSHRCWRTARRILFSSHSSD